MNDFSSHRRRIRAQVKDLKIDHPYATRQALTDAAVAILRLDDRAMHPSSEDLIPVDHESRRTAILETLRQNNETQRIKVEQKLAAEAQRALRGPRLRSWGKKR